MRSYISSSRLKLGLFLAIVAASAVLSEAYVRLSGRFTSEAASLVFRLSENDFTNAVFGDSQIGLTSFIPGFQFFGAPGLQPEEFADVVKYAYAWRKPGRVIVEASPQWFGEYHIGRSKRFVAENLPPRLLPFRPLILSTHIQVALVPNLFVSFDSVIGALLGSTAASAAGLERPEKAELDAALKSWRDEITAHGPAMAFEWSRLSPETRSILALSRVYSQNPRKGFETSASAARFEEALRFLISRGAEVCLFRPPVSPFMSRVEYAIPNSQFAAFDLYIAELSRRMSLKYVTIADLGMDPSDDWFWNQDHLNMQTAKTIWPLVQTQCFGKG
jgi:hypothetical protein